MKSSGYERGFNLPVWSEEGYANESLGDSLKALKDCGVDSVALVPTWYQRGILSSDIRRTNRTASEESLRRAAEKAHALGLRIMLKPHLDIEDGTWRARIFPLRRKAWFKSYSDRILNCARAAQGHGIEMFCIGTELMLLSGHEEWRQLIRDVRAVYSGELTFAANWDSYERVSFWDALDAIGIDFYAPLADGEEGGEEVFRGRIGRWMETLKMFSVKIGKPLLFTEVGYRSTGFAAQRPWDFQTRSEPDQEEQAKCYRAFLEALESNPWIRGVYFWLWDSVSGNASKDGYSPQGKEAEKVLREFWCEGKTKEET